MGLRAMLCYSNVWFIVKLMHIVNDAWYSAVYKYVNVVCAQETDEAYTSAGRLISLGMIGNIVMSIPFSIITVLFMPDIMKLLGYEESIIDLSQGYALIAVINRLVSSTSDILSSILDLEGYAKFNAVFDFWVSLCDLIVVLIFVVWSQPSLKALGVCHLILDLISTGIFYYMTFKKGCFECYTRGIFGCLDISVSDL
jgi:MatE.